MHPVMAQAAEDDLCLSKLYFAQWIDINRQHRRLRVSRIVAAREVVCDNIFAPIGSGLAEALELEPENLFV